jgi:hypothetical protein
MAIFYTDTGSLGRLEVSGSTALSGSSHVLKVQGSGSNIFTVSGSLGSLLEISDTSDGGNIFTIASSSIDVFSIDDTQNVTISGSLVVDIDNITDVQSVAGFTGNKNGYLEVYAQNISAGVSASTDIVAYADNGTETSDFIDMGINSSGVATGYSFGKKNDAYIFNTGGDLFIGNNTAFYEPTVTSQSLFFFSNSSGSPDMTITGSRVGIGKSGSLQATLDVSGSVFITGSLRVSQGITASIFGSSSFAVTSSNALTASFALNAGGGGSGFPFAGTALITGSIVLTSGSGFPSLLASETLAAGDFVNVFSGGVRKASSNDLTKQAHGFVSASYSSTNPVIVYYSGLNTGLTGLTAGARYFLSTNGSEATTPPTATAQLSQEVGVAIATNAILVNFGPAIIT